MNIVAPGRYGQLLALYAIPQSPLSTETQGTYPLRYQSTTARDRLLSEHEVK